MTVLLHGVLSTYTHQGCRCEPCRRAMRRWQQEQRAKYAERREWEPPTSQSWHLRAACQDFDIDSFPDREDPEFDETAYQFIETLCRGCPVQRECLHHALTEPEPYGTWGGSNEVERGQWIRGEHPLFCGCGTFLLADDHRAGRSTCSSGRCKMNKFKRHHEFTYGKHTVERGQLIRFRGVRGQFKFLDHTVNESNDEEWLNVIGPVNSGQEMGRSFRTDRIIKKKPVSGANVKSSGKAPPKRRR